MGKNLNGKKETISRSFESVGQGVLRWGADLPKPQPTCKQCVTTTIDVIHYHNHNHNHNQLVNNVPPL